MTWLRCVDHVTTGETYPLNPAHVVYMRRKDGWWRAHDVLGRAHDVASEDEGKVAALMDGFVLPAAEPPP